MNIIPVKITALIIVLICTTTLIGCGSENTTKTRDKDETPKKTTYSSKDFDSDDSETSNKVFDDDGIYIEEISDTLSKLGTVTFDYELKSYVLTPNSEYTKLILALVKDPTNYEYLTEWERLSEGIAKVSEICSCCICVKNPANPDAYLLIVGFGEIASSTF